MTSFYEAMEFIKEAGIYGSVLGLTTTCELLERLSNPQDYLKYVHVAGTNGKGSVCTYLDSILKESGYYVGRYVSPTVFGYLERIQANGEWITQEEFTRHAKRVKEVVHAMCLAGFAHPTAFEIETAIAFLYFKEKNCDVVVLEVGLGGKLDATNVIKTADCVVITSISMDHMGILGKNLTEIAAQKAGIIKDRVPVVSYPQKEEVYLVLENACREKNTELITMKEASIHHPILKLSGTEFSYSCLPFGDELRLKTKMLGENQVKNAALAVEAAACLRNTGYQISREAVEKGIQNAEWPARFSLIHKNPYVIVDGAHNIDAAQSLNRSQSVYFGDKPLIRVIGTFKDKEYDKILAETVKKQDHVITITPKAERGLDSAILAECAKRCCDKVTDGKTVENALSIAWKEACCEDVILIYGSLSFLHEVYLYFLSKKGEINGNQYI